MNSRQDSQYLKNSNQNDNHLGLSETFTRHLRCFVHPIGFEPPPKLFAKLVRPSSEVTNDNKLSGGVSGPKVPVLST
jgi:hypothetical protein